MSLFHGSTEGAQWLGGRKVDLRSRDFWLVPQLCPWARLLSSTEQLYFAHVPIRLQMNIEAGTNRMHTFVFPWLFAHASPIYSKSYTIKTCYPILMLHQGIHHLLSTNPNNCHMFQHL